MPTLVDYDPFRQPLPTGGTLVDYDPFAQTSAGESVLGPLSFRPYASSLERVDLSPTDTSYLREWSPMPMGGPLSRPELASATTAALRLGASVPVLAAERTLRELSQAFTSDPRQALQSLGLLKDPLVPPKPQRLEGSNLDAAQINAAVRAMQGRGYAEVPADVAPGWALPDPGAAPLALGAGRDPFLTEPPSLPDLTTPGVAPLAEPQGDLGLLKPPGTTVEEENARRRAARQPSFPPTGLLNLARQQTQRDEARLAETMSRATLPEKMLLSAAQSAPVTLGSLAAYGAGGPLAGATLFGAGTFFPEYQAAREAGLPPSKALPYAASQAALELGTELGPAKLFLGPGGLASRLLKGTVADVGGEMAATGTQEPLSVLTGVRKEVPDVPTWLRDKAAEELATAAGAALLLGGPSAVATTLSAAFQPSPWYLTPELVKSYADLYTAPAAETQPKPPERPVIRVTPTGDALITPEQIAAYEQFAAEKPQKAAPPRVESVPTTRTTVAERRRQRAALPEGPYTFETPREAPHKVNLAQPWAHPLGQIAPDVQNLGPPETIQAFEAQRAERKARDEQEAALAAMPQVERGPMQEAMLQGLTRLREAEQAQGPRFSLRPEVEARTQYTEPAESLSTPHETGAPSNLSVFTAPGVKVDRPRIRLQQVGTFRTGFTSVTRPEEAAHVLAPLRRNAQENVAALVTDHAGNVLGVVRHTVGTTINTALDPPALLGAITSFPSARNVWFAHNHPNDSLVPSMADWTTTESLERLLKDSGVTMQGMFIMTAPGTTAALIKPSESAYRRVPTTPAVRRAEVPVFERQFRGPRVGQKEPPLRDPHALRQYLRKNYPKREGALLLNTALQPVGFVDLSVDEMAQMRTNNPATGFGKLMRAMHETGAQHVVVALKSRVDEPAALNLATVANKVALRQVKAPGAVDIVYDSGETYATRHGVPPKTGDKFFSLQDKTETSSLAGKEEQLNQALRQLEKDFDLRGLPPIKVVPDPSALPVEAPPGAEPEGVYYEGRVYLVASVLENTRRLAKVYFHEAVGHHGTQMVLGPRLPRLLDRIVATYQRKPATLGNERLDLDNIAQLEYGRPFLQLVQSEQRQVAEEYIARSSEEGADPLGVMDKIRLAAARVMSAFARERVSPVEVRAVLANARAYVETGTTKSHAPSYSSTEPPEAEAQFSRRPSVAERIREIPGFEKASRYLTPDERFTAVKSAETFISIWKKIKTYEIAQAALAGRAKRGWYWRSAVALTKIFGPDAPRFVSLLAALSPQTSVQWNLRSALGVWNLWQQAGRPTDPNTIGDIVRVGVYPGGRVPDDEKKEFNTWKNNAIRALTAEQPGIDPLSGPKVYSFMRNLLFDVMEVTNDTWIASFLGISQSLFAKKGKKLPGKGPGYKAASARVREAAELLEKMTGEKWTPSEVQETVWSWAKALYELRKKKGNNLTARELLESGALTPEVINSVPDFASLLTQKGYRELVEAGGYGEQLRNLERDQGAVDRGSSVEEASKTRAYEEAEKIARSAAPRALERAADRIERLYQRRLREKKKKKKTGEESARFSLRERTPSTVFFEIAFGDKSPYAQAYGDAWEQLTPMQRVQVTREVGDVVTRLSRAASGVSAAVPIYGLGGWTDAGTTTVAPSIRTAIASDDPERIAAFAAGAGYLAEQTEVWQLDDAPGPTPVLHMLGADETTRQTLANPATLAQFFQALASRDPTFAGFSPAEGGLMTILPDETDVEALHLVVDDTARELGYTIHTTGSWRRLTKYRNDWGEHTDGRLYLERVQEARGTAVRRRLSGDYRADVTRQLEESLRSRGIRFSLRSDNLGGGVSGIAAEGQPLARGDPTDARLGAEERGPGAQARQAPGGLGELPLRADGRVPLTNWGRVAGRGRLDPQYHGKGIPGAESKRKAADPRTYIPRLYFGLRVGEPGGYRKEVGLGPIRRTLSVAPNELYNIKTDPDRLVPVARAQAVEDGSNMFNRLEQLIHTSGYRGYWSPDHQVVALFTSIDIESEVDESKVRYSLRERITNRAQQLRPHLAGYSGTDGQTMTPEQVLTPTGVAPDEIIPGVNLSKINAPQDVKDALVQVERHYHDELARERAIPITWEESNARAVELAQALGADLGKMRKWFPAPGETTARLRAAHRMLVLSAQAVVQQARRAVNGSSEDQLLLQEMMTRHAFLQGQFTRARADAGRALNILRQQVSASEHLPVALDKLLQRYGGRERLDEVARMIAYLDEAGVSPSAISSFVGRAWMPTWFDKLIELFKALLLTGPQTHAVNTTSNFLTQIWGLGEHALAGVLGKLHGGDKVYLREALAKAYGMIEGTREGLALAAHAFLHEDFTARNKGEHHRPAIGGRTGYLVRTSFRLLSAEDEFFKAIARRGEMRALALRAGLAKGLRGRALAEHVEATLRAPPDALLEQANEVADYLTFNSELGRYGAALQRFAGDVKAMQLVLPFIRTPANVVKFMAARNPAMAWILGKELTQQFAAGGATRDLAIARLLLGSAISAWVISLAAQALITGGPPDDSRKRAGWYSNKQPYSVKIGDTWYAYGRLEPLGMLFGMAADFVDIYDRIRKDEADGLSTVIIAAFARNLASKTFLRGITDFARAYVYPDRYVDTWLTGFLGAVVPTGVAQVARTMDPVLRETRVSGEDLSDLEKTWKRAVNVLKSRLPGMSSKLPPKRDWWGDAITFEGGVGPDLVSPIRKQKADTDPLAAELLDHDVTPTEVRRVMGTGSKARELTTQQYDWLQYYVGAWRRYHVANVVRSPAYRNAGFETQKTLLRVALEHGTKDGRKAFLATFRMAQQ